MILQRLFYKKNKLVSLPLNAILKIGVSVNCAYQRQVGAVQLKVFPERMLFVFQADHVPYLLSAHRGKSGENLLHSCLPKRSANKLTGAWPVPVFITRGVAPN